MSRPLQLLNTYGPFVLLTIAWYFIFPSIFDGKLFLGGDNANYFILAEGLSSGQGFTQISSPNMTPGNHFPPGYPFIMSIFMRLGYEDLLIFKWLNGVFLLMSSFVFFGISLLLTKHRWFSFAMGLFLLFNAHLLEYSTVMMSEIPFLFIQLSSIWALLKWHKMDAKLSSPYLYLFLALLILSIYTRTIGVALFGAALLYLLIEKRFKAALLVFALTLLALTPWQIRSHNLGGNSYTKQLMRSKTYDSSSPQMKIADWGTRIKSNAGRYLAKEIPNALIPSAKVPYHDPKTRKMQDSKPFHWVIGILIVLFGLIGILSSKRYRVLLLLLFGGNFTVYLLWPQVWFGVRFMLPMIPFVALFAVLGLRYLTALAFPKTKKFDLLVYAALIVLCIYPSQSVGINKLQIKAKKNHPRNWANYLKAGQWCGANLDKSAVISTRKAGLFYVNSQRKVCGFAYSEDQGAVLESLNDQGVTHVVIEQLGFNQTGKYLLPTIKKNQPKFKLVHSIEADKKNKSGKTKAAVWIFAYNASKGYQGTFKNGLKSGTGSYIYPDGQIMEGTWVQDTIQGEGKLSRLDGYQFLGNWINGKREGRFIIHDPKGSVIETFWKRDTIQQRGFLLNEKGERVKLLKMK